VLKALTREEVEAYIAHRIWVAKGADAVRFDSEAVDTVHAISGGIPRVINLLCDRALMAGAHASSRAIDTDAVLDAGRVLGMNAPDTGAAARPRRWPVPLFVVLVLGGLAFASLLLAAQQKIFPPVAPPAPPVAHAAPVEPRPLPPLSDYPPGPPAPPVVSPTF